MDGQLMLVYTVGDRIILRKVEARESDIFSILAAPVRAKVKKLGITRKDVERVIQETRKRKE